VGNGNAFDVDWTEAERLLKDRDRFTQEAIKKEFESDPEKGAIAFDPEQDGFLTPVFDERYSVIWYKDTPNNRAVVRAVVPLPHVSNSEGLKEYVQRAVLFESKGSIVVQ
jgi:hypothetical protein